MKARICSYRRRCYSAARPGEAPSSVPEDPLPVIAMILQFPNLLDLFQRFSFCLRNLFQNVQEAEKRKRCVQTEHAGQSQGLFEVQEGSGHEKRANPEESGRQ